MELENIKTNDFYKYFHAQLLKTYSKASEVEKEGLDINSLVKLTVKSLLANNDDKVFKDFIQYCFKLIDAENYSTKGFDFNYTEYEEIIINLHASNDKLRKLGKICFDKTECYSFSKTTSKVHRNVPHFQGLIPIGNYKFE